MSMKYYQMNETGLQELYEDLMCVLRIEAREYLKMEVEHGSLRTSSILNLWREEAESAMDRKRDYMEIGGYYSQDKNPVLLTLNQNWFNLISE